MLFAAAVSVAACQDHDDARAADEVAIRAVLAENEAATNDRDSSRVAATFVPEADVLIANGPAIVGVDAIQRNEDEFYEIPGFREWHQTIESIRFLTNDVAIVEVIALTILESDEIRENASVIMQRHQGDWKIAGVRVLGQMQ